MAYSVRYDDETGAPIGVSIDPRDCSDRAWWALVDFCANTETDIRRAQLPLPGYSRVADAERRRRGHAKGNLKATTTVRAENDLDRRDRAIHDARQDGTSVAVLAKRFGISTRAVYKVLAKPRP